MSAFFDSLRSDLLDRRLRPVIALLALALVAAIVYAVLAGSGSSTPAPSVPATTPGGGVAISAVKTEAAQAVAETTGGAGQTSGVTRDPFAPLPTPKASAAAASGAGSSASSSSSSSSSGGSSSSAGSGGESGAPSGGGEASSPSPSPGSSGGANAPAKPKAHAKTAYDVSILFGQAAPNTPVAGAALTPYDKLELAQPLPSAQQPLIVFRGVVAGAKSVTFTLVGEAILRGSAVCRPSASQCQAIDLQVGQTEELEYAPPGATPTNYMLYVASIKSLTTKASQSSATTSHESKVGAELLRSSGLSALPGLRWSTDKGVLVIAGRSAFAARAHAAIVHVLLSAPQGPSAGE